MKKLSILLVVCIVVTLAGNVYAVEGTSVEYERICYTYEQDGNSYIVEAKVYPQYTEARLYKNSALIQISLADMRSGNVETEIYNEMGLLLSTQESAISDIITTERPVDSNPVMLDTYSTPQVRYREPSIYNEPVDNTELYISMNYQGQIYYLIGSATDSFAPEVVASLHRTYTETYEGETKYYTWNAGTTVSAIVSVLASLQNAVRDAIIGLLEFFAGEALAYKTTISLATHTFDYTYQGLVNGEFYYTGARNITYWRIDNVTENTVKWVHKRYNYGYGGSNQDMIRATVENYCRANY